MAEPDLKAIKEYVYTKYVDYGHPEIEVDEDGAIEILGEHFRTTPASVDGENYLLGILLFENAENHPERRKAMLTAARVVFAGYRERTGELDFDPVEDRFQDLEDFLAGLPEKERDSLLEKASKDWGAMEGPAAPAEPEKPAVPGMVLIPAGPFLSGPSKALRETNAFWVDTFPVTNEQYAAFCQATGYRQPKFWTEGRFRTPRAPVVGVSWFDAYKYAAWAGKQLPTFEQWEKAARGKSGRIFPWGDQIDHNKAVYGQPEGSDAVAEVGHCQDNVSEHGARDMVGNIWHWTDTWDKQEPEMKILCGGSWVDPVEFLRLDQHLATNPKDKFDNIGFRCVKPSE
jgi:formylglycine-generating enzyme required for sulfatase activity